ncbi:hypothetical protein GCM10007972_17440 [Iodidimonas muriae]|uniref:Uncharacterized protein n=1 Tax=Iodidimonas muriae TaxID=261467 RepID=A0ABQ2LDQ5_9PROT|nr:hypothetical protein [Iodidimonas muriae]GER08217.1 hypothetical protein JCM17843_25270 [Kordiimonadales bacterium JCM 17843]GGO12450.1 hypothetical protein GCM10007972_17440 [Iodidimonas muriae]
MNTPRKNRLSAASLTLVAAFLLSGTAFAAPDCGDPPLNEPAIPQASKATRESMLAGVNAVKAYSGAVDTWLTCKDRRSVEVFQWMSEEQRTRWEEDLNKVHERRVEVQRQMNEAIREFNKVNTDSNS